MYKRNRKDISTTKTALISNIFTSALIILFSTFAGSLTLQKQQHEQLNVFALQFPKSQQADLMAINSGKSPSTDNFNLPPGYKMQPILWNLSLPTTVTFNDKGNIMYIAEGGFIYGGLESTPRILQLNLKNDNLSVLVDRNLNSPITDLKYHNGKIYVSNRDKISTVDPKTGFVNDIISGLPSAGDHHNNQIAFGYDGRLYFGQGTATNSGVVGGTGSESGGWLKSNPSFHDIPCKDIVLTGQNFNVSNPLSSNPKDNITTGAFVPLGEKTTKGQVVKGNIKCNVSILSSKLDGTDLKILAWGIRNPYGLAFTGDSKSLLVTDNGANEKEPKSRPIASDDNKLYLINISNASN